MHYASSTNGFYSEAIHGDKIPNDAVEITSDKHAALMFAQSSGKRIEADANGYPIAVDPPPLTRAAARAKLIAARDAEITGGFTYLDKPIDSDRDSIMSITGAGVAALAAKSAGLPYSVTWTCADDSTIVLDADGVLGMVVALAMFADAQHAKARPLKDAIKNAKTPDDLGKVVW